MDRSFVKRLIYRRPREIYENLVTFDIVISPAIRSLIIRHLRDSV